jgi:putative MATE family efflux protein
MRVSKQSAPKLTQRPVLPTLFAMALPMLGGTFAMNAFNLTDTWFVAQLGTLPLAAMGFSFPVVMFLGSITRGLGTGATAVVSHALGRHDEELAKRITTHTMILAALVVACVSIGGLLTMNAVFTMLGAETGILPLIREYMTIWYLSVAFMVFPMMASDILRATGDTVSPSLVMVLSSVLNMILDPIMIFGWFGFPPMGIRGAALATLLSMAVSCIVVLWILIHRHHLLLLEIPSWRAMLASWQEVLNIGLPSSFSNILVPISGAVITRMVAQYGEAAVAACSAASRIEMFAFMIPMALGVSLVPFVGQNYGANRLDRVKGGQRYSYGFAFVFGIVIAIIFSIFSDHLARLFSQDQQVLSVLNCYLSIIPLGYGMMEIHRYSGFFLNGIKKPLHSTGVNAMRILGFLIPLSFLGGQFFGIEGIFWGRAIADILAGCGGMIWANTILNRIIYQTRIQERQYYEAKETPIELPLHDA